jgi:rhodanese-related sulfurtransferase
MSAIQILSVQDLAKWREEQRDFVLLDVREDDEVAFAAIDNHVHIPMNLIPLHHSKLPDDKPIAVYCHHGIRSMNVALFLEKAGFDKLYNVAGGIDAWSLEIDPNIARY